MRWHRRCWLVLGWLALAAVFPAFGQGTLEDYQRAERFLPANLERLVETANVEPHWIAKANRFWYRRADAKGAQFILVDAEAIPLGPPLTRSGWPRGCRGPRNENTFRRSCLLRLSRSLRPERQSAFKWKRCPGSARFRVTRAKRPRPRIPTNCCPPTGNGRPLVKDHNLSVRNLSTGQTVALTADGVPGWDYATPLPSLRLMVEQGTEEVKQPPAVFWAPDSSKLVTYRIDSRRAGRFPSIQFVPPDQLRPKAFTVVYPLPGEALPEAQPIIFDMPSGKRIDVQSPGLELPFQDGPEFDWFPDSKTVVYDYDERGFKSKEIRIVDGRNRRAEGPGPRALRPLRRSRRDVLSFRSGDGRNAAYLGARWLESSLSVRQDRTVGEPGNPRAMGRACHRSGRREESAGLFSGQRTRVRRRPLPDPSIQRRFRREESDFTVSRERNP